MLDLSKLVDADFILLTESAQLKSREKEGKLWKIVLIEEGFSKNIDPDTGYPRYYPEDTIHQMKDLFEGAGVFAYGFNVPEEHFFDHLPDKVRDIVPDGLAGNIVGWVEKVKFVKEGNKGRLEGYFHCVAEWLREKLSNAWDEKKTDLLGFSIDVRGYTENEAQDGRMVNAVKVVKSINELTVVTDPAAGGRFLRLVASVNKKGEIKMNGLKELFAKLEEKRPEIKGLEESEKTPEFLIKMLESLEYGMPPEEKSNEAADEVLEKLKGMIKKIITAIKDEKYEEALKGLESVIASSGYPIYGYPFSAYGYPYPVLKTPVAVPAPEGIPAPASPKAPDAGNGKGEGGSDAETRLAAMEKRFADVEAERAIESLVDKDDFLPDAAKEKIRENFKGRTFETEELREAVKREKMMFEKMTESGQVKGLGKELSGIEVGLEESDKVELALDLLLDRSIDKTKEKEYEGVKPFNSIREAYVRITHDDSPTVKGIIPRDRIRESTSSDFPYILGNTLNRRTLKDFKAREQVWRPLVNVVPVKDFKQQELIRWGGFSFLQDLTEDAVYPTLATPMESEETYTAGQKGAQFYVTRKMIINDDTRTLQKLPKKLSKAAIISLEQFVIDLLIGWTASGINTATLADGVVIYNAAHFNLITTAISYDNLTLMIQQMMEQWELGASDEIAEDLDTSETDVDVDTGTKFKIGDYVRVNAEVMRVTDVTSNTLTVVRAEYGTTAATHTTDDTIYVVTDQIGVVPAFLLAPPALEAEAMQWYENTERAGTADRDKNLLYHRLKPVISTRLRGDQNNYYAIAKPDDIEGVEVGFLGGQEEPEIITQDAPSQGNVFIYDRITYKIRHEYGGAPAGYRFGQGGVVA